MRLPSLSWIGVLLLTLLAFVLGLLTAHPILVHLAYVLAVLLLVTPLYVRFSLRLLSISYGTAVSRVSTGDRLLALVTLRSRAYWPIFDVDLYGHPGVARERLHWVAGATPRGVVEWTHLATAATRGRFTVGIVAIGVSDPLGLYTVRRRIAASTVVMVHPRPRIIPQFSLAAARAGDLLPARRSWATMPVSGAIRPFAQGDPSTRIHWLSSARHGSLMVKSSDRSVGQRLWVALDLTSPAHAGSGDESTVEYGVEAAAYVTELAFKAGLSVGLIVAGVKMLVAEPTRGRDQHDYLFDLLAVARSGSGLSLAATIDMCRAARPSDAVVMLTPSADPEFLELSSRLRRMGCGVATVWLDATSFGGAAGEGLERLEDERLPVYVLGRS